MNDEPSPSSPSLSPPRRRLRWLQVRMVTVLLAITVCCVGLAIRQAHVIPYLRQAKARNAFIKRGATLQLKPGQPTWITPVIGKKTHQKQKEIDVASLRGLTKVKQLRRLTIVLQQPKSAEVEALGQMTHLERLTVACWPGAATLLTPVVKKLDGKTALHILEVSSGR